MRSGVAQYVLKTHASHHVRNMREWHATWCIVDELVLRLSHLHITDLPPKRASLKGSSQAPKVLTNGERHVHVPRRRQRGATDADSPVEAAAVEGMGLPPTQFPTMGEPMGAL